MHGLPTKQDPQLCRTSEMPLPADAKLCPAAAASSGLTSLPAQLASAAASIASVSKHRCQALNQAPALQQHSKHVTTTPVLAMHEACWTVKRLLCTQHTTLLGCEWGPPTWVMLAVVTVTLLWRLGEGVNEAPGVPLLQCVDADAHCLLPHWCQVLQHRAESLEASLLV